MIVTGGSTITDASQLGTGVVNSTAILDATIVDADVSATAAVALSKIQGALTRIVKATTETVNNSTTLQNDDSFTFSVSASKDYTVKLLLRVSSGAVPDIKYLWSLPAGATAVGIVTRPVSNDLITFSEAASVTVGTSGTSNMIMLLTIRVGTTAGTAVLQWAQEVAEVSDTSVLVGSWLTHELLN